MRKTSTSLIGRILCLALFSVFLLQNAFAEQPREARERSAHAITHIQDLPAGTMQLSSTRSGDRPLHCDVVIAGALVTDVTAPHILAPSLSAQASPPLASLLTFSQYVTSQL
jgi:hypothetical protein